MSLLPDAAEVADGEAQGLVDLGPAGSGQSVVVVVGLPGQQFRFSTGHVADASGHLSLPWRPLPTQDGIAVSAVPERYAGSARLRVRDGEGEEAEVSGTERVFADVPRMPEPADPRGLRSRADDQQLQSILDYLVGYYTEPAERVAPVLLWAGRLGGGSTASGVLVGITLPSGATAAAMATYEPFNGTTPSSTLFSGGTAPMPAGTPLLDRLIAVYSGDFVTVSGPASGTVAEVVANGAVVSTFPLVDGAGTGPCPEDAEVTVRVRTAAGAVVGTTPLSPIAD
jgi:hypothetical protein